MTSSSEKTTPHYKLVLFDVDGTLVLSEMRNRYAIEQVAKAAGVTVKKEDWDKLAGKAEETIYEHLVDMYPNQGLEDMFFCYDPDSEEAQKKSATQFAGACQVGYKQHIKRVEENTPIVETFNMIADQGIQVGAVSNSKGWSVHASMQHTNFPVHKLALTITKDDVQQAGKRTKPHADPWLMAIEQINEKNQELFGDDYEAITPDQVLIIGDTHTDVKSAMAAHIDVIQITDDCKPMSESQAKIELEKRKSKTNYAFMEATNIHPFVRETLESGSKIKSSYPELKCA